MMTNRPPDQFDAILRRTLDDVAAATQSPVGLADRLIADVPTARVIKFPRRGRWTLPLLAAAVIVALAVAATLVATSGRNAHHVRPAHSTSVAPPPRPAPVPHFRAADIAFSDQQHGWALGDAQCSAGTKTNCPTLLATTDGGASWRRVAVPAGLVSTADGGSCGSNGDVAGPCVDKVLFANASDGYLWSLHEIFSTTDGGRHWQRYVDPARDWDGAAQLVVTGSVAVRLAPIHQCSSGCAGAVETAPIGTTDWRVTTPPHVQVGLYSSALATRGSAVYLFAGGAEADPSPGIYRSSDGQDWTLIARTACGAVPHGGEDPFSPPDSVVADDGALVADCLGVPRSSIRVAPPGTTTFSAPRRLPRGDSLTVLAASTEQRIVVADTAYLDPGNQLQATFYVTTDGGRTWKRTAALVVSGGGARFPSGPFGYAVAAGGSGYYLTTDGGIRWRHLTFGG